MCLGFTVDSPLVQGLRTILALAHDFDVATLSLPILLKELQSEVEAANRVHTCLLYVVCSLILILTLLAE